VEKTYLLSRTVLGVAILACSANALFAEPCKEMVYRHENQIDPKPIELRQVQGTALDPNRTVMPQLCVGIFTEPEHKLLRYAQTDDDGVFAEDIHGLPNGEYRLVVEATGFCPANVIIRIKSHSRKKKLLVMHMNPRGLDTCSFVEPVK